MCIVWTGSDVFLSTTSILHLCAIAIHRFLGIAYPLRVRNILDKRHVLGLLIPAWTISFAISLPQIVQGALDQDHVLMTTQEGSTLCGIFDQTFTIYSSLVSFFIPLAIMVFADIRSVQILRNNIKLPIFGYGRKRTPMRRDSTSMFEVTMDMAQAQSPESQELSRISNFSDPDLIRYTNSPSIPETPQLANRNCSSVNANSVGCPRKKSARGNQSMSYLSMLTARGAKVNNRERRAEKTLIWVFVCFVVLWLPFFCTNLTYGVCRTCHIPDYLFLTFTWLGYVSSGVNPCLYTFLNKDFRNAFRRIITCRIWRHTRKYRSTNNTSVGNTFYCR